MDPSLAGIIVAVIGLGSAALGGAAARRGKRDEQRIREMEFSMSLLEASRRTALEDSTRWEAKVLEASVHAHRMESRVAILEAALRLAGVDVPEEDDG